MKQQRQQLISRDYGAFQARPCPRKTGNLTNWFTHRKTQIRRAPSGVWSLRRASKVITPSRVFNACAYLLGAFLVCWGLYGGFTTLTSRGGSDEILNSLLWIFFGFFLIFLANHEKAVAKKLKMYDN